MEAKPVAEPKKKSKTKKTGRGRPTAYRVGHCKTARKVMELGGIEKDVADALGVNIATVTRWKLKYPDFCASLKLGKEQVDERVKSALVHRALGYSHPEDDIRTVSIGDGMSEIVITPTTKHYPPDTTACIFWLKNRRPEEFRQNPDTNAVDDTPAPSEIIVERKSARIAE